ncbi:MAG TPA: YebC/PmpR family DNA-binding transcriptional regulator [Acholeplasmataceae bacterium]|jgi:YebC/PmpR family DNA-binding regulatory protein|nr:YebC/PmpR family DNA-binding transcriptional regulator [Acholeplasmataceae bacterium]
MGRAFEVRKYAKEKTAAAKTKVYSKYGKEIYVAAKNGQPDPELNQELKRVIERAKKDQVPNDIINRAIEKAAGGSEENYTQVRYEGFGPGNSMVIVECLTDNVNRTYSEVRNCFTKTNSKLGVTGSVLHMFSHQAVFVVKDLTEDDILLIAVEDDLDILNLEIEGDEATIYTDVNNYAKVKSSLQKFKEDIEFIIDEITWIPFTYLKLNDEDQEVFDKLTAMLEDLDDVQSISHNLE